MKAKINVSDFFKLISDKSKENVEFKSTNGYPIANAGLTIYYAPSNFGKSYLSVYVASESRYFRNVLYLDFEGNGKQFQDFCELKGVMYANVVGVTEQEFDGFISKMDLVEVTEPSLIIIDSFSSLFNIPVNKLELVDDKMKKLRDLSLKNNIPILIIDHATINKDVVFGSKYSIRGGDNKIKFANLVVEIEEIEPKVHKLKLTVKKSRLIDIIKNDEFEYTTTKDTLSIEKEFYELLVRRGLIGLDKISVRNKLSKKQREIYKEQLKNIDFIIKYYSKGVKNEK